jgi:plastocyanin
MRKLGFASLAILPLLSTAFLACSSTSDTTSPGADASTTNHDASSPNDAAPPPVDASKPTDAGRDAAMQAMDSGTDSSTPTDSGTDSATPVDAGMDSATPMDSGGGTIHDVAVGQGGTVFVPADITIAVGDTVRWTWMQGGHSVTSGNSTTCTADNVFCSPNDTNCAAGNTSNSGAVYTHVFTTAGTFDYFCSPHCNSGMIGSVTVQ